MIGLRHFGVASRIPLLAATMLACSAGLPNDGRDVRPSPSVSPSAPPANAPLLSFPETPERSFAKTPEHAAATPREEPPEPLVIVVGGDVSLGREVGQSILRDREYAPFDGIESLWENADLRLVNLESPLSEQSGETQSPRNGLVFTGPPSGAEVLKRAGIHGVATANNHAWDYGRSGLLETLHHLKRVGIRPAGTGRDEEAAYRPATFTVQNRRVALFAVTHIWNQGPFSEHEARKLVAWADIPRLQQALRAARAEYDLVLLSYHGGQEYEGAPTEPTRRFVKAVMATGIDAIFGHHPHVIQGIGWFGERPVFYSLGNLVFRPLDAQPWTRYGMLARLELGGDGVRVFQVCPYRVVGDEPRLLHGRFEAKHFAARLRRVSTAVGGLRTDEFDARGCASVRPPATRRPSDPLRARPGSRPLASR